MVRILKINYFYVYYNIILFKRKHNILIIKYIHYFIGNILEAKRKTIQAQDNSNLSSANEGNGELLTRQQKIKKKFLEVENKKKSNALWDDIRSDTS